MSDVVWFDEFDSALAPRLGGKCAALGELTAAGLSVPPGFAVTTDAYRAACGPLQERLRALLAGCAPDDPGGVARIGTAARGARRGRPAARRGARRGGRGLRRAGPPMRHG